MDMNFKKPEIKDKNKVTEILQRYGSIDAMSAFGTYFLWCNYFNLEICVYNDVLFSRVTKPKITYLFPRGLSTNFTFKDTFKIIADLEGTNDINFTSLNENEKKEIENSFPNKWNFTTCRDEYEYIYNRNDLKNLSGKKYHKKRNHISNFNKIYNYTYNSITSENCLKYFDFFDQWFKEHQENKEKYSLSEYDAISRALKNYSSLNLVGGAIKVNEEIVACTIGEKINSTALLVHFEKALNKYKGAYAIINKEFSSQCDATYKYINREEDLGIPGLRKSKLSYHPAFLISKYKTISKKGELI